MKTIKNKIKHFLGRYPFLFSIFYRLQGKNLKLLFCNSTEIVIEGFPRSANTWAVVFFEYFQKRGVNIAHHLHVESQLISAVKNNVPAILLIREPELCIKSLLVRENLASVNSSLRRYIRFYGTLLPYKDKMVVAEFRRVTSDMSSVIDSCNKKFGTQFNIGVMNETIKKELYGFIEAVNIKEDNGHETHVARPSQERNEYYNRINFDDNPYLKEAYVIYEKFTSN